MSPEKRLQEPYEPPHAEEITSEEGSVSTASAGTDEPTPGAD
jgi:hypothetical protein